MTTSKGGLRFFVKKRLCQTTTFYIFTSLSLSLSLSIGPRTHAAITRARTTPPLAVTYILLLDMPLNHHHPAVKHARAHNTRVHTFRMFLWSIQTNIRKTTTWEAQLLFHAAGEAVMDVSRWWYVCNVRTHMYMCGCRQERER